jgi:hypothetical protein
MAAPASDDEMKGAPAALRDGDDPDQTGTVVHIQLLHVPDCPLVEQVRATLRRSLSKTNVGARTEEVGGPYPSPTLLIDGTDVTGRTPAPVSSCRLDLPTEDQLLAALTAASVPEPAS